MLARLWREGRPVRRMGIEISEALGIFVSHNACVARAHRIGLGPHPAGRNGDDQWRNIRAQRSRAAERSGRSQNAPRKAKAERKPPALKPDPIPVQRVEDVARVQLVDLERGQCHWPVGDPKKPGFGYCGCETGSKSMDYCAGHHARAYVRIGGE